MNNLSAVIAKANSLTDMVDNCCLCTSVISAKGLCIEYKEIGLKYMYPQVPPICIFFLAESPPPIGDGFFYDQVNPKSRFRNQLFEYISASGLGPVSSLDV